MSKSQWRFKPRELTRAIESVKANGLTISGVEVDKAGKIIIVTGSPVGHVDRTNEWDEIDGRNQVEIP